MYIGSIIFGKDEPKLPTETQNPVKLYHPMVRTFEFRNGLTKAKLVADAVKGLEKYYEDELGNPMVLGDQ